MDTNPVIGEQAQNQLAPSANEPTQELIETEENNMERVLEVDFNKFAIQVTELSNQRLEDMTTFRFYATVEYLKEKNKKQ